MEQLKEALNVSVKGPLREKVVAEVKEQFAQWGIPLAPSEVLVLDFGLGDFRRYGLVENWVANETKAGYCGKYLFLFKGQTCPRHRHSEKMETFFIVKGRVRLECEGEARELGPGDVFAIAPGKFHEFSGLERSLILELSQPCFVDDNFFENPSIYYGRKGAGDEGEKPAQSASAGEISRGGVGGQHQ